MHKTRPTAVTFAALLLLLLALSSLAMPFLSGQGILLAGGPGNLQFRSLSTQTATVPPGSVPIQSGDVPSGAQRVLGSGVAQTVVFLVITLLGLIAFIGLLRLKRWAWWLGIITCLMILLLAAAATFLMPTPSLDILVLARNALAVATILLLLLPGSRQAFEKQAQGKES